MALSQPRTGPILSARRTFWRIHPPDGLVREPLRPTPVLAIPLFANGPAAPIILNATITIKRVDFDCDDAPDASVVQKILTGLKPVVKPGSRRNLDDTPHPYMQHAYIVLKNIMLERAGKYRLEVDFRCSGGDPAWVEAYNEQHGTSSYAFQVFMDSESHLGNSKSLIA